MATLVPSDQAPPPPPPPPPAIVRRLEGRIKALESEMKTMREEIKSLRGEKRQKVAQAPRAMAYPETCTSGSRPAIAPPPSPISFSGKLGGSDGLGGAAGRSVNARIIASANEATSILSDVARSLKWEKALSSMYDHSKRELEHPRSHGLAKEQARRHMLVQMDKLEEAKPKVRALLASAKDRIAELHRAVRSAMEGADSTPTPGDGDPIKVFQELCDVLKDFEGAVKTYDGSTMDAEATGVLDGKSKEFQVNLEWYKLRLKKVKQAMGGHN